jgi:hypothetical protein
MITIHDHICAWNTLSSSSSGVRACITCCERSIAEHHRAARLVVGGSFGLRRVVT